MTSLENIEFNHAEFQFTTFSDCQLQGVIFNEGLFHIGKFETGDFTYACKSKITFNNISISDVIFNDLDLTETVFINSGTGAGFISCNLSSHTFIRNETKGVISIDFFTIKKSEDLPEDVLKSVFGITAKT